MKKLISLALVFVFIQNLAASPLIFKITKEVKISNPDKLFDIATVDVSKYKQIRVGVLIKGKLADYGNTVFISAVEGEDLIMIGYVYVESTGGNSVLFDVPSNQIKISAKQSGTYKIYVWGTQ